MRAPRCPWKCVGWLSRPKSNVEVKGKFLGKSSLYCSWYFVLTLSVHLRTFMGALGTLSILLSLISPWFQSTISKAHISGRQHILYHDLLDRSKSDLDSMEVNRVLPCISALLRICNHADFRSKKNFDFIPIKTSLNVIEFQNELSKTGSRSDQRFESILETWFDSLSCWKGVFME